MSDKTTIEWTDATWNPITGCTQIGAGCDNCYALTIAERFRGTPAFPNGFDLTYRPHVLDQPLKWKRPRKVFVNSMSDLFHKDIPKSYIDQVFDVMEQADWHTYQMLTKRSSLMRDYLNQRYPMGMPNHIWPGVSVEDRKALSRIGHLCEVKSHRRFISFEPLLEDLGSHLNLRGIAWAIVGGESGLGHRPINAVWVRHIRKACRFSGTAFFFKQWGGRSSKANGRELDGQIFDEMPTLGAAA